MSKPTLDDIHKLPVDIIRAFRKNDYKSNSIPVHIQRYILHLDRAIELHRYEGNMTRAARMLAAEFTNELSLTSAKHRMGDAINFFHLNDAVKNKAWDSYFSDRMMDLAKMAREKGDISEARRCESKAYEFRTKHPDELYDEEKLKPKTELISPDIDPERLGFDPKEFNMRKLWKESDTWIEKQDIDSNEKQRLRDDMSKNLGIDAEDADYEELKD